MSFDGFGFCVSGFVDWFPEFRLCACVPEFGLVFSLVATFGWVDTWITLIV